MKLDNYFRISGLILSIFFFSPATAIVTAQDRKLQMILTKISSDESYLKKLKIKESQLLKKIYELNAYEFLWTKKTEKFQEGFSQIINQSENYGLLKEKYSISFLADSTENEILLTDTILSFLNDIAFGNIPPDFAFNGLGYTNYNCQSIERVLLNSIERNDFKDILISLQPSSKLYKEALNMLQKIIAIRGADSWNEEKIKQTSTLKENQPLLKKLYYLGIIASLKDTVAIEEAKMTEALKRFERMFNLEEGDKLSPIVLEKLNLPMADIQRMLAENINKLRWLHCMENQKYIQINIPSACLKLYAHDSLVLSMKVIVGKPSTPTPVFCAKLNQIIFFPYWNVPRSIAVKEFLPILKRDAHFLDNNGIQVLDAKGQVIDENLLDWKNYNSRNFPYRFRQVTGCDNSLGIVKFDIEDPFSVYMHDTNHKELFGRNKRFLSHGCIRLEKPYDLAAFLLENQERVNNFVKQRFNKNLRPVSVKLKETIPVFVSYLTVDSNDKNEIVFYDNIYHK